jgi:hypothetical protein
MARWVIAKGGLMVIVCAAVGCTESSPARSACEQLLVELGRPVDESSRLVCANVDRAVADGGIVFDASRRADCLAEARDADPSWPVFPTWFREQLPACAELFAGQRLPGEGCHVSLECGAGAYCDGSAGACPGTCRAYTARGEACREAICDPAHDVCDETCRATLGEGEACASSATCAAGLSCLGGACLPPQPEGSTCDLADLTAVTACETGLYCAPDDRCSQRLSEGEACLSREELNALLLEHGVASSLFTYDQCANDLVCQEGACEARVAEGATCSSVDWSSCQLRLSCDPATQACAQPLEIGAACDSLGLPCGLGSFCQLAAGEDRGTCAALRQEGDACGSSFECASLLVCRDGRCGVNLCRDLLTGALAGAVGSG